MNQKIQINASPHLGQKEVHTSPARFKILSAGRRWGKTRLGVNECIDVAGRGGRAWWVAPSYKMSDVGWRPLRQMAAKIGANINLVDRRITFASGGEVSVRSADNPDSLRGESLNLVIMDECAFMKSEAWSEALRPALADRLGRAIFISTPKGRNWFWRLWQMGQQGDPEWESWQFPTSTNPYIAPSEIEAARVTLPERIFRQEFLAEFLEGEGSVFRNILPNLVAAKDKPEYHTGHHKVAGVDWGKHDDFTTISVYCVTCNREIDHDRFNRIDYSFQRERLWTMCNRWGLQSVVAESNSMGEPNIDQLRREGMNIQGFNTTAQSKPQIIESLVLCFERNEAKWISDAIWTGELEAYEMTVNQNTGRPSYSAPSGMHDDTVIARALALYAATRPTAQVINYRR